MIANLHVLGKFFDPQILLKGRSGTFRDSVHNMLVIPDITWYNLISIDISWYYLVKPPFAQGTF